MSSFSLRPESLRSLPFEEKTTSRFQDVKSFQDLVQAVSQGYSIPTTASSDLVAMYAKATKAAASSTAPSTDKSYFSFFKKFQD